MEGAYSVFSFFNTCYRSSFARASYLLNLLRLHGIMLHRRCCLLRSVFHLSGNHQMPHVLTYVPPSLSSRLVYALFWVIAIACKLSTDYFFMFKLLVEPSMDVVHDYALNKNKLEYFFLVCNWVVPVVVYYYSIMIWFQFFCSLVGIYLGFRLKLRRKGVNSLKDRFLAAANMFRKKAIATVEEDANAEINCASKMRNVDCDSDDAESKVVSRRSVSGRLPVQQPHLKSQIPLRVLRRRDNFGFFASFWNELIDSLWQNDLLGYDEKNALSFISLPYAHFDVMSNPAAENVASWHVRKVEANPGMNVRVANAASICASKCLGKERTSLAKTYALNIKLESKFIIPTLPKYNQVAFEGWLYFRELSKEIEIVSFHEGVTVYFLCEISEEVGIDSIVFTFEGLDDDIVIPLEISNKRYTWTQLLISLER